MLTAYLAEIWGITLVVACLSLLVRGNYLKRLFISMDNEDSLFSWGLTSFVIGISMILSYNVWTKDWQIVITLLGWLSLIKGSSLLFFPEFSKKCVKKMENATYLSFLLFVGIFIGLIITYLGFTA